MSFNVSPRTKDQVAAITVAPWSVCVKYLDVLLIDSLDLVVLIDLNLTPILNSVPQQLARWRKLKLSWFGLVTALKMKVLLKFIFLFRNLILLIPVKVLIGIQSMFTSFVWDQKRPRFKAALLQKSKEEGSISLSNVLLYYQAVVLDYLVQWWNPSGKQSWECEQLDIPFPLTE